MAALTACDDKDNNALDREYTNYTLALQQRYPTATNIKWEIEGIYHVADFYVDHNEMEAWYNGDIRWMMSRTEMGRNLLSVSGIVADAFASGDYGTWSIDDIDFYEKPDRQFYVFDVENPGQPDMLLFYNTDGTMIKAIPDTNGFEITPDTAI